MAAYSDISETYRVLNSNKHYAVLYLYINSDNSELRELYVNHVNKHNASIINSGVYANSGFDIFFPDDVTFSHDFLSQMVNHKIRCRMEYINLLEMQSVPSCGYYMYPRSSISKTPLMLANHTGIIDSSYRGDLIGAFRWFGIGNTEWYEDTYMVEKHTRLLQICHPSLCPILVQIVQSENELGTTSRGTGGFGSTGVSGATTSS
jgi:dUTP pyrophosphatase